MELLAGMQKLVFIIFNIKKVKTRCRTLITQQYLTDETI
jgi:hypothetical protein